MNDKLLKFKFLILVIILTSLSGCKSDDDGISSGNITGDWFGTIQYNNPAGGIKYQYMTLSFYDNGIGEIYIETPVSLLLGEFSYTFNGNTINCKGVIGKSDYTYEEDFTLTLRYENSCLFPQNRYNAFILSRDGSIITDTNGNIISGGNDNPNIPEEEKPSSNPDKEKIINIIKNNLNYEVSYYDYDFKVSLESTLEKALPNSKIKYGFGHGALGNSEYYVSMENQCTYFNKSNKDGITKVTMRSPFWCYFVYGMEPNDLETATKAEAYYTSYKNMSFQSWNSFTEDEKTLFNDLKRYLNNYESKASYSYKPTIEILIDKKYYTVCTMQIGYDGKIKVISSIFK